MSMFAWAEIALLSRLAFYIITFINHKNEARNMRRTRDNDTTTGNDTHLWELQYATSGRHRCV